MGARMRAVAGGANASSSAGHGQALPAVQSAGHGILTRLVRLMLAGYRRFVSPALPPACRFHPSCSVYADEAIERYGLMRGAWLAIRRLSKCHPLHPGGFDPLT